MSKRHLFLFGGSPPFTKNLGREFAKYSLKGEGKIAILFLERAGWEEYMPKYTAVLEEYGLKRFIYIAISSCPDSKTLKEVGSCSGIIICGGDTERYRNFIVDSTLGSTIKNMYQNGVPIAGFSAGALITPEHCVISPHDNKRQRQLYRKGLGLLKDCIISAHYSKWEEERNLKTAMSTLDVTFGYGIDDEGCIYFVNEAFIPSFSEHYHLVEN